MSLKSFLQNNEITEGFPEELITALDSFGSPALIASYGISPSPPIISAPQFIPAVMSGLPGALPSLSIWLNMFILDVALYIHTPLLVGSILQLTPAQGSAPAVPITPLAQTLVPSSFPPIALDVQKSMKISKAMMEWAVSLLPIVDLRIAGKFSVFLPSPPKVEIPLPEPKSASLILEETLSTLDLDEDEKNKIRLKIKSSALSTSSQGDSIASNQISKTVDDREDSNRVIYRIKIEC